MNVINKSKISFKCKLKYPKECYYCAYVDKYIVDQEGIHCAKGHLKGKDAWRCKGAKACEFFEEYDGKLD